MGGKSLGARLILLETTGEVIKDIANKMFESLTKNGEIPKCLLKLLNTVVSDLNEEVQKLNEEINK